MGQYLGHYNDQAKVSISILGCGYPDYHYSYRFEVKEETFSEKLLGTPVTGKITRRTTGVKRKHFITRVFIMHLNILYFAIS